LGLGPLSYQILRHSNSLHILTVHAAAGGSTISKLLLTQRLIKYFYEPKFHGLIAVSPASMQTITDFGGFNSGPTKIIPNGIDLIRFAPADVRSLTPHVKNLLFVGRFEKRKGLLHLLRVFKILHDAGRQNLRLIIVGDGEQRKAAESFVAKHHFASIIIFAGNVSDDALSDFYRKADIFCAPAVAGESFGMTLLEAMACGTPIAGFANPGYSYVMQGHEETCGANLLAAPGDDIALAQKIALLVDNQDIYERARQWGLAHAKQFSWTKIADQILNFYEEAHVWQKSATDTVRM